MPETRTRLTLSAVADLARVRRPVVSMWRSRLAGSRTPFPAPSAVERGQELFDATSVARWLRDTEHGNNPEAVADAAAFAVVDAVAPGDSESFFALTALLTLRHELDEPLGELSSSELVDAAKRVDAGDRFLLREVRTHAPGLTRFVDELVEAAYDARGAFESLLAARVRDARRSFAAPRLSSSGLEFVSQLIDAMAPPDDALLVDDVTGAIGDVLAHSGIWSGDRRDVAVFPCADESPAARMTRRRLVVHGAARHPAREAAAQPTLVFAQFPGPADADASASHVLDRIVGILDSLASDVSGLIVAPASALCDGGLSAADSHRRAELLRSSRVRAVARLPRGILPAATRVHLAVWLLGPAQVGLTASQRWSMVTDLDGMTLTNAAVEDLALDLAASLGDRREVRAHAFRFTRVTQLAALLSRKSLLDAPPSLRHTPLAGHARGTPEAGLAVAALRSTLGEDDPLREFSVIVPHEPSHIEAATLGVLADEGHVRCLRGVRLAPEGVGAEGLAVVGPPELVDGSAFGIRRIDPLVLAERYPRARLTSAGDIVFVGGRTPAAWVDVEGASVVEAPARVLRINAEDAAGLLPGILADDIRGAAPGTDWRRWLARRVTLDQRAALPAALDAIAADRAALVARLARVDELRVRLVESVVGGTLAVEPSVTESEDPPHGSEDE